MRYVALTGVIALLALALYATASVKANRAYAGSTSNKAYEDTKKEAGRSRTH